jgi:hypothetical protein
VGIAIVKEVEPDGKGKKRGERNERGRKQRYDIDPGPVPVENILYRLRPESHDIKVELRPGEAYEMEVHMNIVIRPDEE